MYYSVLGRLTMSIVKPRLPETSRACKGRRSNGKKVYRREIGENSGEVKSPPALWRSTHDHVAELRLHRLFFAEVARFSDPAVHYIRRLRHASEVTIKDNAKHLPSS